jgi:hypothetical protein
VDCISCGAEAELYSGGRCQRCVLGATAQRLLTNPDTGVIAPQLQVIVDALTAMHRPNSGLTWIRQPHVDRVLRDLARHPTLTHEVIDQLPAGRTTDYMRNLLVEHDALPSRDERLARFQSWAGTAQQRITTEDHRKLVARFIRWSLEKRLRSMSPVTDSAFLRAKQTVTVTIEFCNWLAAEHNTTVEEVTQAHIDLWQSAGPTTRPCASCKQLQQPNRSTSQLALGISRLHARQARRTNTSPQLPPARSRRARSPLRHPQRTDADHPDRNSRRDARLQPANARSSCSSVRIHLRAVRGDSTRLTSPPAPRSAGGFGVLALSFLPT